MFVPNRYYRFGKSVLLLSALHLIMPIIFGVFLFTLVSFVPDIIVYIASASHFVLSPDQINSLQIAGQNIPVYAALVFVCYVILLILLAWYDYSSHKFMIDEFAVHIRDGILSRRETAIPFRQIQDVDLKETYIHRIFGVAELHVLTAGHDDPDESRQRSSGVFRLVDRRYAIELQKEILNRSGTLGQQAA